MPASIGASCSAPSRYSCVITTLAEQVGNQTDECRTQDRKRLVAAQELLDCRLAKGLEDGDQNQRHQENEYRYLHGMRDGATRMIARRGVPSWEWPWPWPQAQPCS